MNYIELFAGCGGLTLGLETVGFDLLLANELSPMASETFAFNHLDANLEENTKTEKVFWLSSTFNRSQIKERLRENPQDACGLIGKYSDLDGIDPSELKGGLLVGSILDINKKLEDKNKDLLNCIKGGFGTGGVDLVSGGPPCQSFSLAGLRDPNNERNKLPWEFARFVGMVRPKIALLENVSGILNAFNRDGKKYFAWFEVAKAFAAFDYIPLCLNINAKYAGAAQNRPRFIMIALEKEFYGCVKNRCSDNDFRELLEPSFKLYSDFKNNIHRSAHSFKFYDIKKDKKAFQNSILEPFLTTPDFPFSVKDAINDLIAPKIPESAYVKKINTLFSNRFRHLKNKSINHDLRKHTPKVEARFRIYQILNKLPRKDARDIFKYLKTEEELDINPKSIEAFTNETVINLDGQKIKRPTPDVMIEILRGLRSKKQTQRALIGKNPAPATLSIPDDACHYDESLQRTLTVREMARIQSFPDWFQIKSKVTTGGSQRKYEVPQYTQIGNAVPPILGLALGKVCKNILHYAD
jgi:DNA (cytosine-5)-methyltransferase 1